MASPDLNVNLDPSESVVGNLEQSRESLDDWIEPTELRAFSHDDPFQVWAEHFGEEHGLTPERPELSFEERVEKNGYKFEKAWMDEFLDEDYPEVHESETRISAEEIQQTEALINEGVDVIKHPALADPDRRIKGTPDLIVKQSWLDEKFPHREAHGPFYKSSDLSRQEIEDMSPEMREAQGLGIQTPRDEDDPYLVIDLKFTGDVLSDRSARDEYEMQTFLYSKMLEKMQSKTPPSANLVTRDRANQPMPLLVRKNSELQSSWNLTRNKQSDLETKFEEYRDHFRQIMEEGNSLTPGEDELIDYNLSNRDEKFYDLKKEVAQERVEGQDPRLLPRLRVEHRSELESLGYESLEDMLSEDPSEVPLESLSQVGPSTADEIRTLLKSMKEDELSPPAEDAVPESVENEFFVDFEFMNKVMEVPFEDELSRVRDNHENDTYSLNEVSGESMVGMIGLGYRPNDDETIPAIQQEAQSREDLEVDRVSDQMIKISSAEGVDSLEDYASYLNKDFDGKDRVRTKLDRENSELYVDHWKKENFVADRATPEEEKRIFERFLDRMDQLTNGNYQDPSKTNIYHYTHAEIHQTEDVADRHNWNDNHPARHLPWEDLYDAVKNDPMALPGQTGFGLKNVCKKVADQNPKYDPDWPGDLVSGLGAMVMLRDFYDDLEDLDVDASQILNNQRTIEDLAQINGINVDHLHLPDSQAVVGPSDPSSSPDPNSDYPEVHKNQELFSDQNLDEETTRKSLESKRRINILNRYLDADVYGMDRMLEFMRDNCEPELNTEQESLEESSDNVNVSRTPEPSV